MSLRATAAERAWERYKQTKRPPDWNHVNGWAYEPFMAGRRSMARELRLPPVEALDRELGSEAGYQDMYTLGGAARIIAALRRLRRQAGHAPARRKA